MTAVERVEAEVKRLQAILDRRGAFWEDEKAAFDAYSQALAWLREDKAEQDRIEADALAAEKYDPHQQTKDLFKGVKIKLPPKVPV